MAKDVSSPSHPVKSYLGEPRQRDILGNRFC